MPVDRKAYWRKQLQRTAILLLIWAITGFGLSILFVEELNLVMLGEMPLGFWMAQQGSIYIFILLILAYALLSDRADRKAGLDVSRPGRAVQVEPSKSSSSPSSSSSSSSSPSSSPSV